MSEIKIITAKDTVGLGPLDAGFAYGYGLFETIKYADGILSFWAAHWARLGASAKALNLVCDFEENAVLDAIRSLVQQNSITSSMIKLSLLRVDSGSQLYVYARPMGDVSESVELKLETRYPLNPHSLLTGHKTHNYLENLAILEQARADGYYDAIRLDPLDNLAETTIGNLFVYVDGHLRTPSLVHGILPGVIRGQLLDGGNVEVGSYYSDLLQKAEAVYLTNSGSGVLPVSRVAGGGVDCAYDSRGHASYVELNALLEAAERSNSTRIG
ncbi:MAG: aminotransferase class IV [Lentimonas sp.]